MDSKEQELQFEENRQLFIDLKKSVDLLRQEVAESRKEYVAPKDEVSVTGEVKVNTEKIVEVENLDKLDEWLARTSQDITKAIEDNKTPAVKSVTVDNIQDAITKDVSVKNWIEFAKLIQPMVKAIEDKELKTIVNKQDFVFPTSPSKAIPVRLSDGKTFYNAIFQAISQASGGVEDPLAGYQITDRDETTATHYYGYTRAKGQWYILKESSSGAYRYAKGSPLVNGGGLYTDAWNNRADLTYDYYYEVF